MSWSTPVAESSIDSWIDESKQIGAGIDLAGCRYEHDLDEPPPSQYSFLAGVVRNLAAKRILEIGTYHGGTIMAMVRALDPTVVDPQIVTIDVVAHNDAGLREYPQVRQILRDSLAPTTVAEVAGRFDDHVDLLFVDSGHDFRQTFENVAIYGNLLKPRLIIVDDIRLNRSMARMWDKVVSLEPGIVRDVSDLVGRSECGFGLIVPQYPFRWPEMHPLRRAAWRAYWAAGRTVMPRLSPDVQARLRRVVRGQ